MAGAHSREESDVIIMKESGTRESLSPHVCFSFILILIVNGRMSQCERGRWSRKNNNVTRREHDDDADAKRGAWYPPSHRIELRSVSDPRRQSHPNQAAWYYQQNRNLNRTVKAAHKRLSLKN